LLSIKYIKYRSDTGSRRQAKNFQRAGAEKSIFSRFKKSFRVCERENPFQIAFKYEPPPPYNQTGSVLRYLEGFVSVGVS
jgi:hypothetical protein